tara:strand:+ start:141 stop:350 length:210 start_codon:yes stop_codon:yes gene_type:complete
MTAADTTGPAHDPLPASSTPEIISLLMMISFSYKNVGGPDRIRTCNLPLRRGLLYPVEPRNHIIYSEFN